MACSARTTIETAAQNGIGALSFSFVSPEEAKEWVDTYYGIIDSEQCVPAGKSVNPNFSVVFPFMCHQDEETALDRGLDGAHFFSYSLMHYYITGQHRPATTDVWQDFQDNRAAVGLTREPVEGAEGQEPTGEAKAMLEQITSLRRGIGTPAQIADVIRRYEEAGVDQIIFSVQIGKNQHEHIKESLELFAAEVMPEFVERREAREAAKEERLAIGVKEALGRVTDHTKDVSDYVISPELGG
jgi:alkanesulfonate monooxygenase SsuD/methylene tetrahydromethanopterin reductase-like flavin-dependent oxidoreductase (luciferase family)